MNVTKSSMAVKGKSDIATLGMAKIESKRCLLICVLLWQQSITDRVIDHGQKYLWLKRLGSSGSGEEPLCHPVVKGQSSLFQQSVLSVPKLLLQ